jgi:hypothetical protein
MLDERLFDLGQCLVGTNPQNLGVEAGLGRNISCMIATRASCGANSCRNADVDKNV